MGELIKIENYSSTIEFLPFQDPYDLPAFNEFRNRVGLIIGFEYISEIIKVAKNERNILSKTNISQNTIPYNISFHLEKTDNIEKNELVSEISRSIKRVKNVSIKEQLFYLRTKILQSIKQNQ